MVFSEKWAFNRAGKSVSKIGIYALPPSKREIYGCFINSRPNFNDGHNLSLPRHWKCVLIFVRLALITFEKPNSFSMRARFVFFVYEFE
jgi:hypothetical protein